MNEWNVTTRAFDLMPLAALAVDERVRLLHANTSALERFPFLRSGTRLVEAFGEHRLHEAVADVMTSEVSRTLDLRLFGAARRTYRVRVEPAPPGALVFLTDLTEAVAYQELRSQFVANVSHELRTPITALRGMLEAIGDDDIPPDLRRRFADRAVAETQRLETLITDILFLSELEATTPPGHEEQADLTLAAASAIEALDATADAMNAEVTLVAPDGPVPVRLNERMARIVVQNLVENAVKYGGPEARVRVEVRSGVDGAPAEVRVADEGVGIPERHLPHIFERFYRADPSRSKHLGGTGLGLSIVKHIAERAGGHATATSREGFGTTVTVRLPAWSPSPPAGDL